MLISINYGNLPPMMARGKVFFLICLSHLFSTYVPLSERSVKGSPISALFPFDRFFMISSWDNTPLDVPKAFEHRLNPGWNSFPAQATFSGAELQKANYFMAAQIVEIRKSTEYSRIPKLSISLKSELKQLHNFLSESKKLTKDEKAEKYAAIKPTLDEIIFRVNEAIQEAIKETVYSSDDIEAAYAKLVQIGDVMGLDLSEELSQEVMFDSKRLESDSRKHLYSTLIELRNALARDEDLMTPLVEVRSRLGTVYRISFPDYERARTEAHYVLKLVRQKMGWNENDLDQAIKDVKRLMEEIYQIPINDWKDMIPEIPSTHIKGMRLWLKDDETDARLSRDNCFSSVELSYKKGNINVFNLEKSLKLEWIKLCEIFETFYEKEPTEKSEELYRLLCALNDFDLIYYSRQFLFFPWFDPMKYSKRCRIMHAGLHFFKSVVYSPVGKSFALDMMHATNEGIETSKKEKGSQLSDLSMASFRTFCGIMVDTMIPTFFDYSDTNSIPKGLQAGFLDERSYSRRFLSFLREAQFNIFSIEKRMITSGELSTLKRMEKYEIPLMLDTLEYRYDILQLSLLRRVLYESETIENTEIKQAIDTKEIEVITKTIEIEDIKKTKDIKEEAETDCGSDTSSSSSGSSDESIDREVVDFDE